MLRFKINRLSFFILLLPLVFLLCPQSTLAATDYWKTKGVVFRPWDQNNMDYAQECPNCGPIGAIYFVQWNQIHGGVGKYNFGRIINYLKAAQNLQTVPLPDGRRLPKPVVVEVSIFLGSMNDLTPNFVTSRPQPFKCTNKDVTFLVPPYGDDNWKYSYYDLVRGLGQYFEAHKSEFPNLAGFVLGNGYDDEAYPVQSGCDGYNGGYQYTKFLEGLAKTAGESFKTIPVYIPSGGGGFTAALTTAAQTYNIGLKSNTIHDAREANQFASSGNADFQTLINDKKYAVINLPWSAAYLTQGKVSWAFEDARPWGYTTNGGEGTYSQLMLMLALKADWMDFRDVNAFKSFSNIYPYFLKTFVPTYLGQTKSQTPGAWIAFRDIRNSTIYTSWANWERGQEIMCWTGSDGVKNCHSYYVGDFEFYLKKVGDSGSYKVYSDSFPAPAKNQPFGFGRALPDGNYMALKVEDGVGFKSGNKNINLRLIILNSGSGSVDIEFKKADGSSYKETITKGSSLGPTDQFVEVTRSVSNIKFDGSLTNGGDIVVKARGGQSILHLLEIKPTGSGTNPPAPTPTPTVGSSNNNNGGSNNGGNNSGNNNGSNTNTNGFAAGWNYVNWRSTWPSNFTDLPSNCPYVVYNSNNWFYTFVRNYSNSERFNAGQNYYIYCESSYNWP